MYADDTLLLSPSVTRLQHLLHKCEVELAWLDMTTNISKSLCLRIGPRNDVVCATITRLSFDMLVTKTIHTKPTKWPT